MSRFVRIIQPWLVASSRVPRSTRVDRKEHLFGLRQLRRRGLVVAVRRRTGVWISDEQVTRSSVIAGVG